MISVLTTEVCVVGGGPAGGTIARRLAQMGHDVYLIAQPPAARHHVTESLAPNIQPLLEFLGVREQVDRVGFRRTAGAWLQWGAAAQYRSWPAGTGYQVDRRVFDQTLLNAARDAGVRVVTPARARRPYRDDGRWRVPLAAERDHPPISAKFLVVATGKHPLLHGKASRCSARTLALAAQFQGAIAGDGESRVEAGTADWVWGTWSPDGTADVIVFVDPVRAGSGGADAVRRLYRGVIAGSTFWATVTRGAIHSMVRACAAASVAFDTPATAEMIRIGEASFSVDPLSSQGVHAAMQSAIQGSIAVHTILRNPDNADVAIEFFTARQREAVAHHQEWAAACYDEVAGEKSASDFWGTRAQSRAPLTPADIQRHPVRALSALSRITLARDVEVLSTPVIAGDWITRMDGIHHPRLPRPVAFLEGVHLVPLLAALDGGQTMSQILRSWGARIPAATALRILEWLNDRRFIDCSDDSRADFAAAAIAPAMENNDEGFALRSAR